MPISACVEIAQSGKEGVEHPYGFGRAQKHAECHEQFRKLTAVHQVEVVLGVPERCEDGVRVCREESVRVCRPLNGTEMAIHHYKRLREPALLKWCQCGIP